MSDRAQILFVTTPEFKDAIGVFAQSNNKTISEIIRIAVAQYIGYDVELATMSSGPKKKYASKEERIAAQNKKSKESRDFVKKLVEQYMSDEHKDACDSLEDWLKRRAAQGHTTLEE